jgi:putative glutamine amidotransferase
MIKAPKVLVAPPVGELEKQMYKDWLTEYGFKPYFLGTECKNIDAPLILCGGADIGKNPIRDNRELEWISIALKNGQPIIGICRGMQLLNHYFGGTVSNIPEELCENHLNDSFEDDDDHSYRISQFHKVHGFDGNLLEVNSRHHQYCSSVAHNFIITHLGEDGLVEGIRDVKNKIWAVQWHPERNECQNNEYPLNKL